MKKRRVLILPIIMIILIIPLFSIISMFTQEDGVESEVFRKDLIATYSKNGMPDRKLRWQLAVPFAFIKSNKGPMRKRVPDRVKPNSQKIVLRGIIDPETYEILPHPRGQRDMPRSFRMTMSNWVRPPRVDLYSGCISREEHYRKVDPESSLARKCNNKFYCPYMIGKGRWKADIQLHVSYRDDPLACKALEDWVDNITLSIDDDLYR